MATFYNQATLSYSGRAVTSNITTGEIVEVLSVTKTALTETYRIGDTVTYVISLTNSGATPVTGLTVTDTLGAYTTETGVTVTPLTYTEGSLRYFTNGALRPTPTVEAGPPLTVTDVSVPAGGYAHLVYQTTVNDFAPPTTDGTLTNLVSVSGGGITPVTAEETITAEDGALLTITKSVSPAVVPENGQLTYTFVIRNLGNAPAVATDDVTITDAFNPALSDIAVTLNGAALTEPTDYTYEEATGLFATVPGRITVPAATYTSDPTTGEWIITPGIATVTVTGSI